MGLMKKLTSVIVTAGLLVSLVGSAFAASPADIASSAQRMKDLGVIQGDENGDLKLNDSITRAELVTIIVRAFGKKEDAKLLKGAAAYPDTASHWASGEIALAKNIIEGNGFAMGMPDGNFAPQGKVTAAQAVAFLMKFLGVPADKTQAWPNDYLNGAVTAGLISAEDKADLEAVVNADAQRGLVFYLADKAFYGFKLPDGKTMYTKYVKPQAPTLTVTPIDPTIEEKVTVTGDVSSDALAVYVGSTTNAATVTGGKFSAEVSLAVGENEIAVTATDIAGNVVTKTIKVVRTVGAATSIAVSDLTVAAGAAADYAVAVKDAKGNTIADAPVVVTSDLGTYADGKFTAGTKAGAGTITVTSGELTATANVTVTAGALAKLVVTPGTQDMNIGATVKFSAAGADQYDNTVAVSGVTWTASKGIMGADGTYGATADAAGTVTVTAAANGMSGVATVTVFGVATKVQIAAPATMVADSDSETTLTATVLDANGNVAKNYNGDVSFSSTNSARVKVVTGTVTAVNGVAQTTIESTGEKGSVVLSASAPGLAASSVNYATVAQTLTSIQMEVDPGTIAATASSQAGLKFVLLDQNGKNIQDWPSGLTRLTVKVSTSDTDFAKVQGATSKSFDLLEGDYDVDNGITVQDAITGTAKEGSATISAAVTAPSSYTNVPVTSSSVSSLFVGDPDAIKVDAIATKKASQSVTVTFRVVDVHGNQITTGTGKANLTTGQYDVTVKKDGETVVWSTPIDDENMNNGAGTFVIDWSDINMAGSDISSTAGEYTVKVSAANQGLTAGEATATVVADKAAKLSLSASPKTIAADGVSTSTLSVKVKDNYGNTVTDGSYDVKVTRTGAKVTSAPAEQVVTTSNGVATIELTSTTKVGTDYFTATAVDAKLTSVSNYAVKVAILGAPNRVAILDGDGDAFDTTDVDNPFNAYTGTAGEDVSIDVAVQDAGKNTLTADNGTAVTLEVFDGTTSLGSYTGTTENGVASIDVNVTKAKSGLKLVATSGDLVKATKTSALTVGAAAPASVEVSADRETLAASTPGTVAEVTVTLKDEFGNSAEADGATPVYLQASSDRYGEFVVWDGTAWDSATVVGGAGAWSDWYQVTIADEESEGTINWQSNYRPGTVTLTAANDDLTEGSVDLTSEVVGEASALAISVSGDTKASLGTVNANGTKPSTTKFQEVTVQVTDSAGNVRTQDGAGVEVSLDFDNGTTADANVKIYTKGAPLADGTATYVEYDANDDIEVVKGQMTFYVASMDAVDVDYTASADFADEDAEATGTFVAGDAVGIAVQESDPNIVPGDGVTPVGVVAYVVDALGNKVAGQDGTITFSITRGSDYASLQETSASVVDGEATVIAKAKEVTSEYDVYVKATADFDLDGDGEDDTTDGTFVFTVDGQRPEASAVKNLAGTVYTVTFDETLDEHPASLSANDFDLADGQVLGGTGFSATFTNDTTLVITLGTDDTLDDNALYLKSDVELKDAQGNAFDTDTPVVTSVEA